MSSNPWNKPKILTDLISHSSLSLAWFWNAIWTHILFLLSWREIKLERARLELICLSLIHLKMRYIVSFHSKGMKKWNSCLCLVCKYMFKYTSLDSHVYRRVHPFSFSTDHWWNLLPANYMSWDGCDSCVSVRQQFLQEHALTVGRINTQNYPF